MHHRLIPLALAVAATALSTSSAASSTQNLNHHVRPDKLTSGPVKLSFKAPAVYNKNGVFFASVGLGRRALVTIEGLSAPASVRCKIDAAEAAHDVEIAEFLGDQETGNTETITVDGTDEVEWIAVPNPMGDYTYELTFEYVALYTKRHKVYSCHVQTL